MKIVIPFFALIFGLIIGYNLNNSSSEIKEVKPQVQNNQFTEKQNSIKKAFENISQKDLAEYIQLKDMRKKYEKADEILGKVMLLFLANVGSNIEPKVKNYFTSNNPDRDYVAPETVIEVQVKENEGPEVILNDDKEKLKEDFSILSQIKEEGFAQSHARLGGIQIENAFGEFNKAKPLSDLNQLRYMYGIFEGDVYFFNGNHKGKTHQVDLEINLKQEENKLTGMYLLKLSEEGRVYSENRGGGDNRQVRYSTGSKCYLLEVNPESFICVRKTNDQQGSISGKFYSKNLYVGVVKLHRKN